MLITIQIVDIANGSVPVSGASVTAALTEDTSGTDYGSAQSTTNDSGVVTLRLRRAPRGIYTTTDTNVTKSAFDWYRENTTYTGTH